MPVEENIDKFVLCDREHPSCKECEKAKSYRYFSDNKAFDGSFAGKEDYYDIYDMEARSSVIGYENSEKYIVDNLKEWKKTRLAKKKSKLPKSNLNLLKILEYIYKI